MKVILIAAMSLIALSSSAFARDCTAVMHARAWRVAHMSVQSDGQPTEIKGTMMPTNQVVRTNAKNVYVLTYKQVLDFTSIGGALEEQDLAVVVLATENCRILDVSGTNLGPVSAPTP